jgi:hypothetical protein
VTNAGPDFPAYAWPGGYPIAYLDERAGDSLCAKCAANESEADGTEFAAGVHWEGAPLVCAGCNVEIPSAYGDPDEDA